MHKPYQASVATPVSQPGSFYGGVGEPPLLSLELVFGALLFANLHTKYCTVCAADAEEDDGSAARAAMCRPSQFCLALPYTTCMCIRTWLRCIGLWVCFPRPNYLCGMAYSGLGMPDTHNVFTIPSPPGFQCAECPETATPKSYQ